MDKIQDREGIAKLPVTEWEDALQEFLAPVAAQAPDVRVRRLFILVLRAPLFVYHLGVTWPRDAIRWLRCLGGKRGLRIDRDGPDVLLAGIRAVFVTAATRAFAAHHPSCRLRHRRNAGLRRPSSVSGRTYIVVGNHQIWVS